MSEQLTTSVLENLNLHCTDHVPHEDCEGCVLQLEPIVAALTAAAEREQALREEVDSLNAGIENAVVLHDALEADVARLTGELDQWVECEARLCPEDVGLDEYIPALKVDRELAESALAAKDQKVTELRQWLESLLPAPPLEHGTDVLPAYVKVILKRMDALGLAPPKTGEPA